jgi:hypothetical protein
LPRLCSFLAAQEGPKGFRYVIDDVVPSRLPVVEVAAIRTGDAADPAKSVTKAHEDFWEFAGDAALTHLHLPTACQTTLRQICRRGSFAIEQACRPCELCLGDHLFR